MLTDVVVKEIGRVAPVRTKVCVAPAPFRLLSVSVSVPLTAPSALLGGLRLRPIRHACPGASEVVDVHSEDAPVCNMNPAVVEIPLILSGLLPVVKMENVVGGPDVPAAWISRFNGIADA